MILICFMPQKKGSREKVRRSTFDVCCLDLFVCLFVCYAASARSDRHITNEVCNE